MQIVPRVSVYGNRVVLPVSDGYEAAATDLVSLIEKAHETYGTVILEDINAILGGIPHLDLLRKVEKWDVWVDGGVRFSENVMDVLVAGGAKVVIGSKTLQSFGELEDALKLTENIVFQIDYCRRVLGRIAARFRTVTQIIEEAKRAGVETFIFMDNHCSPSPLEEARNLPVEVLRNLYVGILSEKQEEEAEDYELKGIVVEALEAMPDE